jgi:LysM repeat protein
MTFRAVVFQSLRIALACVVLSGCSPGSGPLDEEKEPHFLAGKNRISTLDYKGAVECFEKALQANPRSAAAHFELACIFDQKDVDPAAAIYHYQRYLQLRPHAENADLTKQRISSCKQILAESVSLGPVTEKLQRQFEQLTEENKRLNEENKQMKEDLEKWSSYAARLQTLTNPPEVAATPVAAPSRSSPLPPSSAVDPPSTSTARNQPSSGAANRSHTVRAGETPSSIARRYGIKLEALMSANPRLDARRLKVGQVLHIPGS